MIPTLTVRETVLFSARLRLPSVMNDAEREERTDAVIRQMGLSHVANTKGLVKEVSKFDLTIVF
jgi:ABC-type multidrug transport system ATPase subunit